MIKDYTCCRCKKTIKANVYYEEIGEVEVHYKCPHCGFIRDWAYGSYGAEDSEFGIDMCEESAIYFDTLNEITIEEITQIIKEKGLKLDPWNVYIKNSARNKFLLEHTTFPF